MENHEKILTHSPKRVLWSILILIMSTLTILFYVVTISSKPNGQIVSSFAPFKSIFHNPSPSQNSLRGSTNDKLPLKEGSRIAICLVGGARRFKLTGPSLIERVLRVYNNSDLYLHSPLASNAYNFLLLKDEPRIAGVRIFVPKLILITAEAARVTANNSPNGIQGLLQYFKLVEGCLTMINSYQEKNNVTYDWIIHTQVDGYWSDPLGPENFIPGQYLRLITCGLNDRFGVGDYNTSLIALS